MAIPGWPPGRTWVAASPRPREAHRRPTARDPAAAANTATPPHTADHTATGGVRGGCGPDLGRGGRPETDAPHGICSRYCPLMAR